MDAGVKDIAIFTAASEAFCQKNMNSSIKQTLLEFEKVTHQANDKNVSIRGYQTPSSLVTFVA